MTIILPVYTGATKGEIIASAYEECGVSAADYDLTGEEYAKGLRRLNALMADWKAQGLDLGYNVPSYGIGEANEPAGLPQSAIHTVSMGLALRLMPTEGASLTPETRGAYARSFALLRARYAVVPTMALPIARPHRGSYDAYGTFS